MNGIARVSFILFCAVAAPAFNEAQAKNFVAQGGCVLRASAYVDRNYSPSESSRYELQIIRAPKDGCQWDFTTEDDPDYHYTNLSGGISPVPYGTKKQTILHATLHQYETYDERVTFTNLELGPLTSNPFGIPFGGEGKFKTTPRYLSVTKPVTVTTPSGISITLPAQGAETLVGALTGNLNALFIQIVTSPNQREVVLPLSPLYQKRHKPATIKLECLWPDMLVSYMADNTYKTIAVGLRDLKIVTHLDTFTLIVRQRVELQTIPVSIPLQISRSANN